MKLLSKPNSVLNQFDNYCKDIIILMPEEARDQLDAIL